MQVIVKMRYRPEQYVEQKLHRRVQPPSLCPSCTKRNRLKAHGYYERGVTNTAGHVCAIATRRFKCKHCGVTVSCLPSFAQPYRLVNNQTIEHYFNGQTTRLDVQRNEARLRRYWRGFEKWAPRLRKRLGSALGRAPPWEKAEALWQRLMGAYKTFNTCTRHLVLDFQSTCFRVYLCHQPRPTR